MEQLASLLLHSRTQAHTFHFGVKGIGSHSAHIALGEYYSEIGEIIDGLVESYQGKYGIIRGYSSPATFREDDDTIKYFEGLVKYVELDNHS